MENCFEATWTANTNPLSVWKEHFSVFSQFLSDKVKTVFCEYEANPSRLFKSKFDHSKLLRKLFWSYLELKKQMLRAFKKRIFQFFANFWVTKWKPFPRKMMQSVQNYLNQKLFIRSLLGNGFQPTLSFKTNVLNVWKGHVSIFCRFFEWWCWNRFLGKQGKTFKTVKMKNWS